jgi:hypothetical protein
LRAVSGERDLEVRLEALRQELVVLITTLNQLGQRLEDLTDELRSRREVDNVVAFDLPPRRRSRHDPDLLFDFLE